MFQHGFEDGRSHVAKSVGAASVISLWPLGNSQQENRDFSLTTYGTEFCQQFE
jgi:hypothetical protein